MDQVDTEVVIDDLYELSIYELVFWCVLYSIIALLAVLGNALVIWVTLNRLDKSASITNIFIINLAFSDFMTGLFAIPFKFQAALFQRWFLPHFLCQLVPFIETVSLSVSVFTLTTSAVHEFRTFFLPKNNRMNSRTCRVLVSAIWLIAVAVSLPQGLFHEVFEYENGENAIIYQCRPVYADEDWWKVYNIYLTIIHYFVPLIIIDSAYSMIAFRICNTALRENSDHQADYTLDISNRHVDGTIPPSYSVKSRKRYFRWRYINVLFFCCHWLAMSNSCLNPIIYGLYNDRYKREYKRVVMLLRCIKLDDDSDEDRFRNKRESFNNTNNRPNKHHDGISKNIKCNKQQLDGSLAHNKCTAVDL